MENKNNFLSYVKAQTFSIISTLVCILIFAFTIKILELPDSCIVPVNYVIKSLCIFLGVLSLTKDKTEGLKKGFIHGILYVIIAFLVFSFLNKTFSISISLLLEILLGGILGGIIGIVLVNFRKTKI